MGNNRTFRVIDGGSGDGKTVATYIETSPAGENERGGDGGGGVTSIFKLDVARDVQWMKIGWGFLLPALVWFFIYFIGEMKDVRKDISNVDSKVSAQSTKLDDINGSLDRIEMRFDSPNGHQPEASQGAGQAGPVHRGTRSRTGG